jgi:hypothetical protein
VAFVGQLVVRVPLDDRGERTLALPLIYVTADGDPITVPAGARTDYASVPRLLHAILPPTGRYTYPAVVHDHLYRAGNVSRAHADRIFLEAMREVRVSLLQRWVMWAGVRVGGWVPWRRYRHRSQSGSHLRA